MMVFDILLAFVLFVMRNERSAPRFAPVFPQFLI